MEWFLIIVAALLIIHALIAAYLWRGTSRMGEGTGPSMARGILIRFVIVPVALAVALVLMALWAPHPRDVAPWIIVAVLLAYVVYLSLSAIYFGVRLMREQQR